MRFICTGLAMAAAPLLTAASPIDNSAIHTGGHGHKVVPLYEGGRLIDLVSGDPGKAGSPYVIRIHNYARMVVPPHWHPEDEHIVVVKGRWHLGHGDTFDRAELRALEVGDYALVPKRMNHFGWSESETIIQVHGIGPFSTNFVTEWKSLSDPKADAAFKFKQNQRVLSPAGPVSVRSGYSSARDRITQYLVEKPNGEKFFAVENELRETR